MITGSESGPNRRPCDLEWVVSIKNQCAESAIPVFIKQANVDGKFVKMPEIDGQVWNQVPVLS